MEERIIRKKERKDQARNLSFYVITFSYHIFEIQTLITIAQKTSGQNPFLMTVYKIHENGFIYLFIFKSIKKNVYSGTKATSLLLYTFRKHLEEKTFNSVLQINQISYFIVFFCIYLNLLFQTKAQIDGKNTTRIISILIKFKRFL